MISRASQYAFAKFVRIREHPFRITCVSLSTTCHAAEALRCRHADKPKTMRQQLANSVCVRISDFSHSGKVPNNSDCQCHRAVVHGQELQHGLGVHVPCFAHAGEELHGSPADIRVSICQELQHGLGVHVPCFASAELHGSPADVGVSICQQLQHRVDQALAVG